MCGLTVWKGQKKSMGFHRKNKYCRTETIPSVHSHEDRTVAEEMVFLYIRSSIWKKLNNLVDTTIPVCYDNKKHYHSFISEKSFILKERQCLIPKNQKKSREVV